MNIPDVIVAAAENASDGTDYTGELFVIGGIVLTAILGWISAIIVKKMREPTRIETLWGRIDILTTEVYGDGKGIPGLKVRVESAERRAAAGSRIIVDLARQWPSSTPPRLNPTDIDVLDENTIPKHWKVKP